MSDQDTTETTEKVNPNYPEGAKEIAELLTFLPEANREGMVDAIAKNMLQF